jgi:amino acid permease
MKKATLLSIIVTTVFYLLCGCMGYAAFGDNVPGNLLTGFGFYNPYWLLDIANLAIVVHLVGAYQVIQSIVFFFIYYIVSPAYPNLFGIKGFAVVVVLYSFSIFFLQYSVTFLFSTHLLLTLTISD